MQRRCRSPKSGASRTSRGSRGVLDFVSSIYTVTPLITGQWEALVDSLRHLILPAIALGTIPLAIIARITRSSLLEVLGLDYVRTARAKGLDDRAVRPQARDAQRDAARGDDHRAPARALLGGAVLTETIFNLAGVGTNAVSRRSRAVTTS